MALRVTQEYQITTSSPRGFSSIDLWHEIYERYIASRKQRLILIVLSDFDPEGEQIPQVGGRTLRDDFGINDLEIIKAGVTRDQINSTTCPLKISRKRSLRITTGSSNATTATIRFMNSKRSIRRRCSKTLEDTITSVLDVELYNAEVAAEDYEATYLEAAHKKAMEAFQGLGD